MTRATPEAYCEWCVARMRVSQGLRREHETQTVCTAIHARKCGVVSAPRTGPDTGRSQASPVFIGETSG